MMKMIRVLVIPLLILVLLAGQGFAAISSRPGACCQNIGMHQAMACCHHGACEQHTNSKSTRIGKKVSACYCSPAPVDLRQENNLSPADNDTPVSALPARPTLSLQDGDTDAPIWLRRIYYPDKSGLYRDKNSWLL